jgi:excisionase family DNA binding protein
MTKRSSAVAASAPRRYRRQEVAEQNGVSVRTVDRWIRSGALPVVKLPSRGRNGTVLIEHDALQEFLATHEQ